MNVRRNGVGDCEIALDLEIGFDCDIVAGVRDD